MTNADRIRSMSNEELARFLYNMGDDCAWSRAFYRAICAQCPASEYTFESGRTMPLHECELPDGQCPHGDELPWWLEQEAEQ